MISGISHEELERIAVEKEKKTNAKGMTFKSLGNELYNKLESKKTSSPRKSLAKSDDLTEIKQYIQEQIQSSINEIKGSLSNLETRISSVEKHLSLNTSTGLPSNVTLNREEFASKLRQKYDFINNNERHGGMVPIHELWDEFRRDGIGRDQFVNGLYELEKARIIDLQIASDPKFIKEPEKAIRNPTRGLINYVVWRR